MKNYDNIPDNELVKLAQGGDDSALEAALLRYKPLVHKKSQPYYLAGGDDDDIVQEGLIGLYKAVMSFDETKFPLFNVFAGVCIERRIISAVKKASRQKHSPLNSYVSLSIPSDEIGTTVEESVIGVGNSPEDILLERESFFGLEGKINNLLSPLELKVMRCLVNGKSYKETADYLGKDVKSIDNAMQRIKRKLEEIVPEGGE